MANLQTIVVAALKAANVPCDSVSFVDVANRATWRVQFAASATAQDRATAQTILDTVAVDAAAMHVQDQKDVRAYVDAMSLIDTAKDLTTLDQINLIRSKLPVPLAAITPAQWIAAVKAKVDTL